MGNSKPTTMRDVAKRAGVSPATVSRTLTGSRSVSPETRTRILAAVKELGYQADRHARSLSHKRAGLIGLLIPYYDKHLYCDIAYAIAERLRDFEYNLVLCVSQDDSAIEREYLTLLRDKGVDGIIHSHAARGTNSDLVRQTASEGIPIIELVRRREEDLLDAVLVDDAGGAYLMTNYLIGRGHRRIALTGGAPDLWPRKRRLEGYARALAHAGLSMEPDLVRPGPLTAEQAADVTRELLDLRDPPTAIFTIGVRALLGTLDAIRRRGLRIPDDVSIGTFEDLDWLAVYCPPITSVAAPSQGLAQAAVALLQERMSHPRSQHEPDCLVLGVRLHERESCSDLKGRQRLAADAASPSWAGWDNGEAGAGR